MDQNTRNTLRNVVTQCRRLLEDSVAQVLQGQFGIFAVGKKDEVQIEPEARMSHLSEEDRAYRQDLLDHFEHIKALGYKAKDALAQLIREVAFTHLNRFCAYRMMESRGLIRESVSKGLKSQGFLFYLADHEEDERRYNTGQQDLAYRHFLNWLGGTLSEEIGVLFAPTDPANRLYPPQRVIDEVLGLLNDPELAGIWSEDEAIGWVYQYFTPKELRDQARKESQAPRNSYELAFRNQFFTPRYVVEFLTDNTLGRIWYEMRRGDTRLKDQCRYMVRRPTEVFLKEGEKEPDGAATATEDLSQEELLKLPVYVPFRAKKDPRELRILDPACGSGHFLLYCFDLLLMIYEEAYSDPDLGPALKKDYPSLDDLRRDVPRLILAHNLHGIDIDLRASQIAALALWLRCQRAYQEMGIKQDRPKITRSNTVCAEPMPGEETMLKEFVGQLQPPLLGQLVEAVFHRMTLAGEAGALLDVPSQIREVVHVARKQWAEFNSQSTDPSGQPMLFSAREMQGLRLRSSERGQFTVAGIDDGVFFEQAENQIVSALRDYAISASATDRLRPRLFAEDAERGFAFVEIFTRQFDVVLMNPPFGDPSKPSRRYLDNAYAHLSNCISVAFVQMGCRCLAPRGKLGILSPRNPFYLESFAAFRRDILWNAHPVTQVADLGFGVLDDAMVETSAFTLDHTPQANPPCVLVYRLLDHSVAERPHVLFKSIDDQSLPSVHAVTLHTLRRIPQSPFAYFLPHKLIAWMIRGPHLLDIADGKWGLFTADDERFVRCWWEVPPGGYWKPYFKGGSFTRFVFDSPLVVNWRDQGADIRTNVTADGKQRYRIPNSEFYFRPGLTFPNVTFKGLAMRALPEGSIFSLKGPAIFPKQSTEALWLLPLLNTRVCECFVVGQAPTRRWDLAQIMRIPVPIVDDRTRQELGGLACEGFRLQRDLWSLNETSHFFSGMSIQVDEASSLQAIEHRQRVVCDTIDKEMASLLARCEQHAAKIYQLDESEIQAVQALTGVQSHSHEEREADEELPEDEASSFASDVVSFMVGVLLGRFQPPTPKPQPHVQSDPFAAHPHVSPAISIERRTAGEQLRNDVMAVDDETHLEDLVAQWRQVLASTFKQSAESLERDLCDSLRAKTIRDYFRKPGKGGFWDDHISRYSKSRRKAPIYWLLQSSKKNYAIWLYYHRLDKDILFKALVNYVEPKIRLENDRLEFLRSQKASGEAGKGAKKLDKEIEKQEEFLSELRDFEEKLRRAADLHLVPDLNDGVVLNIAPLHELVPWKEPEKYWEELLEGKHGWSSIGKQLREKGLVK
jgi:hypothetical protein